MCGEEIEPQLAVSIKWCGNGRPKLGVRLVHLFLKYRVFFIQPVTFCKCET